jgi:hypothetical protein
MNYKRFDRHELFDTFLMKYHSTTIRLVEDYLLETGQPLYNDLTNMLNGIWDGYLYDELLIKSLILPKEDYRRVEDMVNIINEHIESKTLTKL